MPRYLFEAAYTNDSWATQVQSREDVVERVPLLTEVLGGRVQAVLRDRNGDGVSHLLSTVGGRHTHVVAG